MVGFDHFSTVLGFLSGKPAKFFRSRVDCLKKCGTIPTRWAADPVISRVK